MTKNDLKWLLMTFYVSNKSIEVFGVISDQLESFNSQGNKTIFYTIDLQRPVSFFGRVS